MKACGYSVAKFFPKTVRDEPVNIGIVIHDKSSGVAYGKFVSGFDVLRERYTNEGIGMPEVVLDGYRGRFKADKDYLEKLHKSSGFTLAFTPSRFVSTDSPESTLESMFNEFVSVEPKHVRASTRTNATLYRRVGEGIKRHGFKGGSVSKGQFIAGRIGKSRFDYCFKNGYFRDAVQTISFEGSQISAARAIKDAKALATSTRDVKSEHPGLAVTAITCPPKDGRMLEEFYAPAAEYLRSDGCEVVDEKDVDGFLTSIKARLGE